MDNLHMSLVKDRVIVILFLMIVLLTGCSTLSTEGNDSGAATKQHITATATTLLTEEESLPSPEQTSPHPSQFSKQTLYNLLVAEIAGQRGDLDLLVTNYTRAAIETRDTGVVKRAINAAQYARKEQPLTQLTKLWSELDAANVDAHQLAAFQLIKSKNYPAALKHMEKVLELEGPTTFDRLALHANSLGDADKARLLALYSQILERHPDNSELIYGYAVLQELNGEYEAALANTDRLLQKDKVNPAVIALRARVVKQVNGLDESLKYLQTEVKNHPNEMEIGTLYGRTLIEAKQFIEAQAVYSQLLESFPDAPHLRLSFSLIALENENPGLAKEQLTHLVEEGKHLNEAHFYLGRIADQGDLPNDAIYHYQQVTKGGHYLDALARATYLLTQQGRPDDAAAIFNNARQSLPEKAVELWELEINLMLEQHSLQRALELADIAIGEYPEELDLRYARAMIRDQQGQLQEMENDLRYIINIEPDNSVALNALGYTLADKTDRLDEAFELVSRANALDPDNPAILDSMGWVLYRRGELQKAVIYLQQAYKKFPDPEVAAHLGEVLWMLGREKDALKVWQEAHKKAPEHRILSRTLERLSIDI